MTLSSHFSPVYTIQALVTLLHNRHGLDTNNFANYHAVSNIGFVSKVLERYVANAVREHVDNNGYLMPFRVPIDGVIALIIILVLPPVACQSSDRALPMPGTADGDAISRCQNTHRHSCPSTSCMSVIRSCPPNAWHSRWRCY